MTDPNYSALLLIIDRSGSMAGIRDDMVGGLSTMLAEQAAEPGRLTVDIVTFDTEIETQCSLADPATVAITLEPRGATALFDAIGQSVTSFGRVLAALPEHTRPDTVQVVVVTDGEENSSREFGLDAVRALVTQQKEQYSWGFMFLGANQDAVLSGERLGFDADSSMTYSAGAEAVSSMSASMGRYVSDVRGKSKRGFDAEERLSAMSPEPVPSAAAAPQSVPAAPAKPASGSRGRKKR
ncbi:VWA domain-containing protein [Cryobacterium sp. 1639]|uniref:VWA domain-containing protein n=1 Tax=Cryobacterium inferilacus TaxID=2866629 RepID=UPI001C735B7E|nr:VWA domain-containing protein [Cryobacterium sp. 1639]MBX0301131.1 VWA domain-containing protein [Cryobacterium sp. 1639]